MIALALSRGALSPDKLELLTHRVVKTLMWWETIPETPEVRNTYTNV